MLEKEFDHFVRDQFEDHSSTVPADMWQRIKGKDNKDRKVFLFWKWYFLVPAFLALSLVGGQLFFRPAIHTRPAVPASNGARPRAQSSQNANFPATLTKTATPAGSTTTTTTPANPANAQPLINANPSSCTPAIASRLTASQPATAAIHSDGSSTHAAPAAPPSAWAATTLAAPPLPSTETAPHQPSDRPSPPPIPPATAGTHRPQSLSCPDPSKKFSRHKGWYLEALGSLDYPVPRSSLDSSPIQQLPRLSYTAALRVTKIFESGFLITAGLQYSRINLRNKYDSLDLPRHFNNVDLPLLIGYEKGNDRFKLGIRGGMIFNIHSWAGGGQYFGNYLKSNTGLSSYIGVELIRQLDDRISIFAEPYYKHQFSDMFKNPFVEKIDVAGIFLGLRFTLGSSDQ